MKEFRLLNGYRIVQLLDKRSNVFLIETPDQYVVVDSGKKNAHNVLLENLSSVIQDGKPVSWLILTHTHFDHCGNAAALKAHFKLKVAVGRDEARDLLSGQSTLPEGTNMLTHLFSSMSENIPPEFFSFDPVKPSLMVKERMSVLPGVVLIPTPGHSIGSLSVVVNDEYALVGDVLFGVYKDHIMPPYADDVKLLLKSWQVLLKTNCQWFLPGHGQVISRADFETAFDYYGKIAGVIDDEKPT